MEVLFLLEALNAFRDPSLGGHFILYCDCECAVCDFGNGGHYKAGESCFAGVTTLWESLLCPKGEDANFHRPECLLGACSSCGMLFMKLCPRERVDVPRVTIMWKQFYNEVIGSTDDGRPKKRIKEISHTTSFSEFLDFFRLTMQRFTWHNFKVRWQADQAKLLH